MAVYMGGHGVFVAIGLEPRIDGLALQREDTEHALVHATERFTADESLEPFDTQRKLPKREATLGGQATVAQAIEVLGQRVFRTVDDPQIFPAAALHRRLCEPVLSLHHEVVRLHDHTFPTG